MDNLQAIAIWHLQWCKSMIGVNFDPIQTKVPLWSSAEAKACVPWGANTHSQ
jgi:hypothetical protein